MDTVSWLSSLESLGNNFEDSRGKGLSQKKVLQSTLFNGPKDDNMKEKLFLFVVAVIFIL